MNGPFRPDILLIRDSQASGLGYRNEPFRLEYQKHHKSETSRLALQAAVLTTPRFLRSSPILTLFAHASDSDFDSRDPNRFANN